MNNGMASWQELKIDYEINQIFPNISNRLKEIERIPTGFGIKILTIFIEWACQPQNIHPIEIARKKIKAIPSDWGHSALITPEGFQRKWDSNEQHCEPNRVAVGSLCYLKVLGLVNTERYQKDYKEGEDEAFFWSRALNSRS